MERHFESELKDLKTEVLLMGGYVEKAIEFAVQSLVDRDNEGFARVYEIEKKINAAHIKIDEMCLGLFALQSPLAKDLRFIVAALKINTDLERMGDQAVNLSRSGEHYLKRNPLPVMEDISSMATSVQKMVRDVLDAFVNSNASLAQDVLRRDDEVDALKHRLFRELIDQYMKTSPEKIDAAVDLLLMARNLERLGDHATNIAEDVIFVGTGKDIRHGASYGG